MFFFYGHNYFTPPKMITICTMNADVLSLIADCGLEVTFTIAKVCSAWREAVEQSSHYDTWRALSGLKETSLMCDLVTALRLSPAKIKQGEYTRKRRHGGGFYNIFSHSSAVQLFRANGGFAGLEVRIQKYQKHQKQSSRAFK